MTIVGAAIAGERVSRRAKATVLHIAARLALLVVGGIDAACRWTTQRVGDGGDGRARSKREPMGRPETLKRR